MMWIVALLKWVCLGVGVLVVLLVGGLWLFRRKIVAFFKLLASDGAQPVRISLVPLEESDTWRSRGDMKRHMSDLTALGFEHVENYFIPELAGLKLAGFVKPDEDLLACVYDHALMKPTFDICLEFEDGSSLDGTNTAMTDVLDPRPGHVRVSMEKASVAEILAGVRENRDSAKAALPVSAAEFAADFQKSWVRDMMWRLSKGGVSRDEIKRTAEAQGQELSDEQLEEVYKETREGFLANVQEACVESYLFGQQLDPREAEDLEHQLFALPHAIEPSEIKDILQDYLGINAEVSHYVQQASTSVDMCEAISYLEEQAFPLLGVARVGETPEPLTSVVYRFTETAASMA